jgi:hypothetical protein
MASNPSKRLQTDYTNVLVSIFDLMLSTGFEGGELERICLSALGRATAKARVGTKDETGGLMTAALVLDAWHRDRRYLDRNGAPKAVPLLGPAPSVEAMVRSQRPKKHPADIAQRLHILNLVVSNRRKLYKPSSDVAVISSRDPLVLQHTVRALSALLATVGRNVNGTRGLSPLIERHAEVPDLPRRDVEAFQNFTQIQGRTFLRTINDWLESRRARRSSREGAIQTVRAGVHTYAYFAPSQKVT